MLQEVVAGKRSCKTTLLRMTQRKAYTLPIFQRTGPLTEELLLEPARFGLGMVPAKMQTRCGRKSHLRFLFDRLQSGHSSAQWRSGWFYAFGRLPSQSRHGVSQGLGSALGAKIAGSRHDAAAAKCRGSSGTVDWHMALSTFVDRMKAIQSAHGPHSIAFLSTGQIVTEEMALLARWPNLAWACCTATAIRGNAWPRR